MSNNNPVVIEVIADDLAPSDFEHLPQQQGARAIFFIDDQLCLCYLKNKNMHTLPGGQLESNETAEAALVREVKEETGYDVTHYEKRCIIKEFFPEMRYEHHYFFCKVNKTPTALQLTKEELDLKMSVTFQPLETALSLLSNEDHDDPFVKTIQNRELLAIMNSLKD